MPTVYSNPRLELVIDDYPIGGKKRGQCRFFVETNKNGSRVGRQTTGKPKYHTYYEKVAIVDGDDGRTYVLQYTKEYNFVNVSNSAFMQHESVFPKNDPERFGMLMSLIEQANLPPIA